MEATKSIWMDGAQVPWDQANVHVLSHTLHYGFGIFEGIRAYRVGDGKGAVFRLEEHCQRFVDTARISGLKQPYTTQQLVEACLETLKVNELEEAYVRPVCYLGLGGMNVISSVNPVHVAIGVWHWGAYLGDEGMKKGIRCCVSTFTRIGLNDHLPKGKINGHYVNSILAKDEALRLGFDEALMTDRDGHVLEGSSENLFYVKNGVIVTPPLESSILGGITRDSVLTLAEEMNIEVKEKMFGRDSLYLADEVFLTGTAAEVTPVREIDGRDIGGGVPGPITLKLQARYREVVRGETDDHAQWRANYQI